MGECLLRRTLALGVSRRLPPSQPLIPIRIPVVMAAGFGNVVRLGDEFLALRAHRLPKN